MIFVDCSTFPLSENPSDESCFCRRVKIIRDTTAAKRPVAQSREIAKINGTMKNKLVPIILSKNSSDFREAISAKVPATRRPTTDKIVIGK